jgi:hypothetical protein
MPPTFHSNITYTKHGSISFVQYCMDGWNICQQINTFHTFICIKSGLLVHILMPFSLETEPWINYSFLFHLRIPQVNWFELSEIHTHLHFCELSTCFTWWNYTTLNSLKFGLGYGYFQMITTFVERSHFQDLRIFSFTDNIRDVRLRDQVIHIQT